MTARGAWWHGWVGMRMCHRKHAWAGGIEGPQATPKKVPMLSLINLHVHRPGSGVWRGTGPKAKGYVAAWIPKKSDSPNCWVLGPSSNCMRFPKSTDNVDRTLTWPKVVLPNISWPKNTPMHSKLCACRGMRIRAQGRKGPKGTVVADSRYPQ